MLAPVWLLSQTQGLRAAPRSVLGVGGGRHAILTSWHASCISDLSCQKWDLLELYFSGLGDLTQRDFASAWLHPDVSQHVWAAESGAVVLDASRWQVLQALRAHEHRCQQ